MGRNNEDLRLGAAHGRAYHGTHVDLTPGELVLPAEHPTSRFDGEAYGGGDSAWATEDLEDAKSYGPKVFEVEHIEPPSTTADWPDDMAAGAGVVGRRNYASQKGFRVVKRVVP